MSPAVAAALWLLTAAVSALSALLWVRLSRLRREADALRTQLRAREGQSDEQHGILRTLLDATPVAVMFCAETGRIVFENETARRLFFEGRAAAGQNFLQLVADGPEAFRAALLGASDEIVGLTVEGRRETYHFARRLVPYRGEPHTLLVVRPMTREVARHDVEVLRKVVRLISHEVNNSLAPVSSLVHSARSIVASGERLERLERVFDTVDERARHLSRFIAGYAELSRLPRPVLSRVEWKGVFTRLSALFPRARLEAPPGAASTCDPGQLEQALINLLRNACESGSPPEQVALEVTPLEDGAVELRVVDRGSGFTPEALEQALLPFYTTKQGGSGVGLALVREVVQAHGGRLALGARAGGGASVSLYLPGNQRDDDAATRARLTLTLTRA